MLAKYGYNVIKYWSNTDQILTKYWSNVGKTGIERQQILVKYWSNSDQIWVKYDIEYQELKGICQKRNPACNIPLADFL